MTFKESLANRHSYYKLSNHSAISDTEIEEILKWVLNHVPSAYNSQSTRLVLLLKEQHISFWNIVKSTLKNIVSEKTFSKTEEKINTSFSSGYGTILFFEDEGVVTHFQEQFPAFKENFARWSEHTNAMHQLSVWLMIEETGMGASLQHYNPVIDKEVKETFSLPENWRLIAQMPFGEILDKDHPEKPKEPIEKRLKVLK